VLSVWELREHERVLVILAGGYDTRKSTHARILEDAAITGILAARPSERETPLIPLRRPTLTGTIMCDNCADRRGDHANMERSGRASKPSR